MEGFLLFLILSGGILVWVRFLLLERRMRVLEAVILHGPTASGIEFYIIEAGQQRKVEFMNLKVTQSLPLSIRITDKFGNAAVVEGAPSWSLTDPALGSLSVAPDGMSAVLAPAGAVGAMKVQVSADADLGEGVRSIMGELDVELLPGDAEVIAIAAGEPV